MKEKLWTYLIHLNANMWPGGDPESRIYLDPNADFYAASEKLSLEWDKFNQTLEYLPTQGINTLIIDLGNAIKYDCHPEIAMKEGLSKDEAKKLCDKVRALGMEPVPKLNFSCCHDPWLRKYSYMVGTEEYAKVCNELIDETCEIFDAKYFHLGLDEENFALQGAYGIRHVRGAHFWWRDAHRLFERCEHNNARPWVWSDDYWYHPEEFKKNMPKSVLQSNWNYDNISFGEKNGTYRKKEFQYYVDLDRLGYDQVPTCSTWASATNTDATFRMCKNDLSEEHFLGIMTAPWTNCQGSTNLLCLQEAKRFGLAKKKYFPDENGGKK
ncbi:MAG: hypothetical protein E7646_00420 [Ruminococcaceae bacterium]|nr:hypothetical protein [Oscillospiraceae bacterium]